MEKVYLVNIFSTNQDELALATCVQGLVNKKKPQIVLDIDNYRDYIDSSRYEIEHIDYLSMFKKYLPQFKDVVLYEVSNKNTEMNAAFSYAVATGYLAVPTSLVHLLGKDVVVHENLHELGLSNLGIQKYVFEKFKDKYSKKGLIHQVINEHSFLIPLRDFAFINDFFILYVNESKGDREFLDEVLSYLNPCIPIYGWTSDEISFVKQISYYGDVIVAMDWSANHSFFEHKKPSQMKRNFEWKNEILPNKHYVCLQVSDGDNIQWLERDFAFNSYFGERIRSEMRYPLTYSISPVLGELNPDSMEYIYSCPAQVDFVCGVSGYGYTNPCVYPKEYLDDYTKKTAEAMKLADIDIVVILDNIKHIEENIERVLASYSQHEEIVGGILEIDPCKYEGGNGKIYWSNNKPFVSVRYSFWDGADCPEFAREEFLKEMADKINALPVMPDKEEGYSLINVHPWSNHLYDLDKFVTMLDDHIQLLGAEEFISLIKTRLHK